MPITTRLVLPIAIKRPLMPCLARLCSSFAFEVNTHQKSSCEGRLYVADLVMQDPLLASENYSRPVFADIVRTLKSLGTEIGALPVVDVLRQDFFDLKPPDKIPKKIREVFAAACNRPEAAKMHSPSVLAVAIHPDLRLTAEEAEIVNELLRPLGLERRMSLARIFQHVA